MLHRGVLLLPSYLLESFVQSGGNGLLNEIWLLSVRVLCGLRNKVDMLAILVAGARFQR